MADTQTGQRLAPAGSELGSRSGLRVRPQRPARALFGLFLVAVCVVAVLVIYTRIGDRQEVLAVTRTVLAGEQLTNADLRVVSISADDSFPSVPATARSAIVGQYAKVRLVDRSLIVADSVQARPLVDPSKVLMSVPVPSSGVPTGLREGSRLVLVVTPQAAATVAAPVLVEATVAAVPRNLGELVSGGGDSNNSSSAVALTVEVDPSDVATIGPAEAVAVAVLAPDSPFPTTPPPADGDVTTRHPRAGPDRRWLMTVVALVESAGTSTATTSGVALAAAAPAGWQSLFAECDPSGGDLAAWAELSDTPGWTTSVSTGDRSWDGLRAHMQETPSGLSVLLAPTRARVARTVVRESATRFGPVLTSLSDVITFADCGRFDESPPAWSAAASLVLLLVRQAPSSAAATVARVDRASEAMDRLSRLNTRVGVVVVGGRPYDPAEVAATVGGELFGVLAEDPIGASQVGGAWTVGRGAGRSALLRSARPVAQAITDVLTTPGLMAVQHPSEAAG